MMIVYHLLAKDRAFFVDCRDAATALKFWTADASVAQLGAYRPVATVDTSDVERAYERTNHIDCHWQDNPDVTPLRAGHGERSTSVGDIVVDTIEQKAHFCAPFGWEQLAVLSLIPTHT